MNTISEQNKLLENAVKEISATLVSSATTTTNMKASQRFGSNISLVSHFQFIKQGAGTTEVINRLINAIEAKKAPTDSGNTVKFEANVQNDIMEINSVS